MDGLQSALLPGEQITADYDIASSRFAKLSVTNFRCFLWRSDMSMVTEFTRDKLSSVDYMQYAVWPVGALVGLLALVFFIIAAKEYGDTSAIMVFVGVLTSAIAAALLFEIEMVKFWVAGRSEPIAIHKTRYLWMPKSTALRTLMLTARAAGA